MERDESMTTTICIKNLRLRTIIGIREFERSNKQDVIINATIEVDTARAAETDNIDDAYNYRTITKKIIDFVEQSNYFLLEKLAAKILEMILAEPRALAAEVEIDKPTALRFADSVSVKLSSNK